MYDITKLVTQEIFDELLVILPTPKQKKYGRRRCAKEALLSGILQVLANDVPWNKIAECGCSYSSCYRYFNELQRRGFLKLIFDRLARGRTDIIECAADTDSTTSFHFRRGVGYDGRHKKYATKISLLSDKNGLPADVEFGAGNIHDKTFIHTHLENTKGRRKRELNLDKVYVSLELRRDMRKKGCHVNMKMRAGDYIRKKGPKFKLDEEKYRVRFLVEKCFAWLENFRRLRIRREYKLAMFKAFVYLALIIILIRN
jgi:transposase